MENKKKLQDNYKILTDYISCRGSKPMSSKKVAKFLDIDHSKIDSIVGTLEWDEKFMQDNFKDCGLSYILSPKGLIFIIMNSHSLMGEKVKEYFIEEFYNMNQKITEKLQKDEHS